MGKIIKSEYRYPLFFVGFMAMVLSAFASRYAHLGPRAAALLACMGFVVLLMSLSPF